MELIANGTRDPFDANSWKNDSRYKGQVMTPLDMAATMAAWVTHFNPKTILDPGVGMGGLLYACSVANEGKSTFTGLDIDGDVLQLALEAAPAGTQLLCLDYLKSRNLGYQGITANPPYIKASRAKYTEDDWKYFENEFGIKLNRNTNVYCLFLLKILFDLSPGGSAAVLLPAEFLNANFGTSVKKRLIECKHVAAIIVMNTGANLFGKHVSTSALVLLHKTGKEQGLLTYVHDSAPNSVQRIVDSLIHNTQCEGYRASLIYDLNPAEKWINKVEVTLEANPLFTRKIGDYFRCVRGIATGANDFFCLRLSDANKHSIDFDSVAYCLCDSKDAKGLVFTEDNLVDVVESDRQCLLLNPVSVSPSMQAYLDSGVEAGIDKRYLTSLRKPWYKPENKESADILAPVFSREGFRFILNKTYVKNLACYHCMYAKEGFKDILVHAVLFLNSTLGKAAFNTVKRYYGNNLSKLEPKDVSDMPCIEFVSCAPEIESALVKRLVALETLSVADRLKEIDAMLCKYPKL